MEGDTEWHYKFQVNCLCGRVKVGSDSQSVVFPPSQTVIDDRRRQTRVVNAKTRACVEATSKGASGMIQYSYIQRQVND